MIDEYSKSAALCPAKKRLRGIHDQFKLDWSKFDGSPREAMEGVIDNLNDKGGITHLFETGVDKNLATTFKRRVQESMK